MLNVELYAKLALLKVREAVKNVFTEESGEVNIVAIVVLIGIAVILALAFKDAIIGVLQDLFAAIRGKTGEITEGASL